MPRPKTEAEMQKEEQSFFEYLQSRPKKPIIIPPDPNNPDDVVPVSINGVCYAIPRGQEFMVPDLIYDVWKESYDKTLATQRQIKVSENKEIVITR